MNHKKITLLLILGMILFIGVASAEVIEIEQSSFDINMFSGETFSQSLTINTDGNYLVHLDYNVTNNTYNTDGFFINFIPESPLWIDGSKKVLVEISTSPAFQADNFTLNIFAQTSKVTDLVSENYTGNNSKIDTGLGLTLGMNSTGTGDITIQKYDSNPVSGFGVPDLEKFFEIDAESDVIDNLGTSRIEVSYTDAEVAAAGIDESTLRLYFFNETSDVWEIIDAPKGGVDTVNNIVFADTTHFSTWGIFGSTFVITEGTTSSGGGGLCTTEWTCSEWSACSVEGTQTRTCSYPENWCEPEIAKPVEIQTCDIEEEETEDEIIESEETPQGFFATITGAVIGGLGTGGGIIVLIVLVVLGAAVVFIVRQNRVKGKKEV